MKTVALLLASWSWSKEKGWEGGKEESRPLGDFYLINL